MKLKRLLEQGNFKKIDNIVDPYLDSVGFQVLITSSVGEYLHSRGEHSGLGVTPVGAGLPAGLADVDASDGHLMLQKSILDRLGNEKTIIDCESSSCSITAFPFDTAVDSRQVLFIHNLYAYNHDFYSLLFAYIKEAVGVGVEINNLTREIVRNYEELAMLYDLSSQLCSKPELDITCATIARQVLKALDVEYVSIMLLDETDSKLVSEIALDRSGKNFPQYELLLDGGPATDVVSNGVSRIISNQGEIAAYLPGISVKSMLMVPMLVRDKVIGVVYVSNDADAEVFSSNDQKILMSIALVAGMSIHNSLLYEDMTNLFWNTVKSLTSAIDAKDKYTMGHSKRVAEMTIAIAREMNVEDELLDDIRLAALLHDIGKIGTPEYILFKDGVLTGEEWEEIKKHPYHSCNILKEIKQFDRISEWVMYEHERFDGLGYPQNISGTNIPLPSRIIAAADAFDAMTSNRSYRVGMSESEAVELMKNGSGTQFDPNVVNAFLVAYEKGNLTIKDLA